MSKSVPLSIRFFTATLALALLGGQIEYRALYCRMMRQSMPQHAIARCAQQPAGENGTSELRAVPRCGKPALLSKQVTDKYELAPTAPTPAPSISSLPLYPPPVFAAQISLASFEPGRPPPDILIETRNLRI